MRHFLLVASLGAALAAQGCPRPVPPAAGWPSQLDPVVPVTYSDGYQTFGTLLHPAVPPPSCGWPLVVFVHPLGQTRADDLALQALIAGQGHAVWSYDVRGHGQAVAANPAHPQAGSTLWGPVERCDLAEQIQFVASQPQWAGVVDATRAAVVGSSQGGVHAWNAAAFSGQPLAVPGRTATVFPVIACAVANDYVAEPIEDWLRDGILWSSWFLEALAGAYAPLVIDPTLLQTARQAFVAQDPAALLAYFANEGRGLAPRLSQSAVPVLYSHAYHDRIDSPLQSLRLLQGMTAPHRALLSTVGHNTPANLAERGFRDGMIVRWLNRYLWAEANEVELEAPFVLSELPLQQVQRDDPAHVWSRQHLSNPLLPQQPQRLHLHGDGSLQPQPEAAPTTAVIAQTIQPQAANFTPTDYLNQPAVRDLPAVLAACPLQELVYAVPVAQESELGSAVQLHLRVVPNHADWMCAVLLTVATPGPGSEEVMLASQAIASSTSTPGVAEDHDVLLPPVAARLPAGSVVRLRLRNLWLREAPMAQALEVAPRFHDFQVTVVHSDAAGGSWCDLPLHPVRPKLVTGTTWFDLATAPAVPLLLRGGALRAGFPYYITAGVSGHLPPTPFLNDVMPLQDDWLVGIVSAGAILQPEFQGFFGLLDGNGEAQGLLNFGPYAPLPAALTGLRLSFAAFVFDGLAGTSGAASNPCDVFLR